MGTVTGNETSYAWQLDFRHEFIPNFAWSTAWINEGHVAQHHRDGFATQAWANIFSTDQIAAAIGAGGYRYFDTQFLGNGQTLDVHGWTPIYSLSLTYYAQSPWRFELRANRINESNGLASTSVLAGAGYLFGKQSRRRDDGGPHPAEHTTGNELSFFTGKAIVNTAGSEQSTAQGMEFRHGIAKNFDWTFAWINEGDPKIIRRNGVASQLWVVDEYFGRHLALGLGLGGYFFVDQRGSPDPKNKTLGNVAVLISPTFSYRLTENWQTRLTWNRVVSDYNRDADVIMVGLGYRWGRHD
jgi:hypothetical protein